MKMPKSNKKWSNRNMANAVIKLFSSQGDYGNAFVTNVTEDDDRGYIDVTIEWQYPMREFVIEDGISYHSQRVITRIRIVEEWAEMI